MSVYPSSRGPLCALLSSALFALAGCSSPAPYAELLGGGIRADHLARHSSVLASDEFEGRAPGTRGEELTVAYISEQFAAAGLQPAGDHGGWTQAVTLERSEIRGPVTALLQVNGHTRALDNGEGFMGCG